jgi:uncharacterized protein (TIGR04222 family)
MWSLSLLVGYLGVAAGIAAYSLRHRIASGHTRAAGTGREAEPAEVAYLNGGPDLAVTASLGALGLLGVVESRSAELSTRAPLPADAGPLDRAVHAAAARGVPARTLRTDPGVTAVLDLVHEAVVAAGWLRPEADRRRVRRGAWLMYGLALIGLTLIGLTAGGAGADGGGPDLAGFSATIVVAVIGTALAVVPRATRAGQRVVRAAERAHGHLRSTMDPSWTTYGIRGAAMAVALYGPDLLWTAAPVFAGRIGIVESAARRRPRVVRRSAGAAGAGPADGGGGDCGDGCGGCGE